MTTTVEIAKGEMPDPVGAPRDGKGDDPVDSNRREKKREPPNPERMVFRSRIPTKNWAMKSSIVLNSAAESLESIRRIVSRAGPVSAIRFRTKCDTDLPR